MDSTKDIKKEVRKYLIVFYALMALTIVTVAISYLKVPVYIAVTLALIVAITKGSLVCCYFMHLISERKLILTLLASTIILFASMIFLFVAGYYDLPEGSYYYDQKHSVVSTQTHDSHKTLKHEGEH